MTTTIYTRQLGKGGFLGVDFSSEASDTDPRRLSECVNLWHDPAAGAGTYLETRPGLRKLAGPGGAIHALAGYASPADPAGRTYLIIHAGTALWAAQTTAGETALAPVKVAEGLADTESTLCAVGDRMAVLDGTAYRLLSFDPAAGTFSLAVAQDLYTPVTYEDDAPAEQRNALSGSVRQAWTLSYPAARSSGSPGLLFEITSEVAGTCRVKGIDVPTRALRIPAAARIGAKTYRVTEVRARAFQNDNTLESVTVEEGVEVIGRYAFNTCLGLVSVRLPGSVHTLCKGCFAGSAVTSLHLGTGLDCIEDYAFFGCDSLGSLTYEGTAEDWEAVSVGTHNDPLTDLSPVTETWGPEEPQCLTFDLSERLTGLSAVTLGGVPLPAEDYSLTVDTQAREGVTYYTLTGRVYAPATVTPGASLPAGLYERNPVRYTPLTRTEGTETLTVGLVLWSDRESLLRDKRLEITGLLSSLSQTETVAPTWGLTSAVGAAIHTCRLAAVFDGRLFLSGSPAAPGAVFYSQRDAEGHNHPGYFGVCNYFRDGLGAAANVAMTATPDTLYVYKDRPTEEGSVFCHRGQDTALPQVPRIYPAVSGVSGVCCVGAACHFADDPVFLTPEGLSSIYVTALTSERGLSHRSSRVDARLLGEDLAGARAVSWQGYLVLLCPGGRAYLADSRRVDPSEAGHREYEWVFWDGLGSYADDLTLYRYATALPEGTVSFSLPDVGPVTLCPHPDGWPFGSPEEYLARAPLGILSAPLTALDEDGEQTPLTCPYVTETDGEGLVHRYLLTPTSERVGGTFSAASVLCAVGDRLFFGTPSGDVLTLGTDLRLPAADGTGYRVLPPEAYDDCGHAYTSGGVTAPDDADLPCRSKMTERDGSLLDVKALASGRLTLRLCTDRRDWRDIGVWVEGTLDFGAWDAGSAVFAAKGGGPAVFYEKTRPWGQKQYALVSHDYRRPIGFGAITYRYRAAGRMKNP